MLLSFHLEPGDDDLFREESLEYVHALEESLLALERPDATRATIDAAFRSAHTLKGGAATIGHTRMADLTHVMEDLLGLVRSDPAAPASRIAGELLAAVDIVRTLVDEVRARTTLTDEVEAARASLLGLLAELTGNPPTPARTALAADGSRSAAATATVESGDAETSLLCTVDPASEWRAVRLLQILMEADATGRLLSSDPDLARIEADEVEDRILLRLARPDDTLALEERVASIDEVLSVQREATLPQPVPVAAAPTPVVALAQASSRVTAQIAGRGDRSTIRVDVARLDALMNLVGELVVQKTQFDRLARRLRTNLGGDSLAAEADEATRQFASITGQIHESVTGLRMLPVATVFEALPRLARDVAARLGREVTLAVEGGDVELDRGILEGLGAPLGHLLRNAIDHGIEPPADRTAAGKPAAGQIRIRASQTEGRVTIVVEDDGRGIDIDAVRRKAVERRLVAPATADVLTDGEAVDLLFRPGFSTAVEITDVSGRGVGLDVVRSEVGRLGGSVRMASRPGAGSVVTLTLPLTLAIMSALLVRSGNAVFAIPLSSISETVRVDRASITTIVGHAGIVLRGQVIEIVPLFAAMTREGDAPPWPTIVDAVVIHGEVGEIALAVDELIGNQEIVLKSVDGLVRAVHGIAGATVLPDGGVALVIDVQAIARSTAVSPMGRTA